MLVLRLMVCVVLFIAVLICLLCCFVFALVSDFAGWWFIFTTLECIVILGNSVVILCSY